MPTTGGGSRRDFAALEARRLQAATLFAQGESQGAVARALGVTPAATNHWHQAWQAEGRPGLRAAGRAGRKPRIEPTQWARIERALRAGPGAHGFSTDVWTLPRVATLIDDDLPAGIHSIPWDGRTADGAEVPSGLYYARCASDGRAGPSATLVRIRS